MPTKSKDVEHVYRKMVMAFTSPLLFGQKVSIGDGINIDAEDMDYWLCHYWDGISTLFSPLISLIDMHQTKH